MNEAQSAAAPQQPMRCPEDGGECGAGGYCRPEPQQHKPLSDEQIESIVTEWWGEKTGAAMDICVGFARIVERASYTHPHTTPSKPEAEPSHRHRRVPARRAVRKAPHAAHSPGIVAPSVRPAALLQPGTHDNRQPCPQHTRAASAANRLARDNGRRHPH